VKTELLPEGSVLTSNGEGSSVEVTPGRAYVCCLVVEEIIEQESLDVSICGSEDGSNFRARPLVKFPQRFYSGRTQVVLDLADFPGVKFLKVRWEVLRWGRGSPQAMFRAHVTVEEVALSVAVQ
jgi:hypothetical protein